MTSNTPPVKIDDLDVQVLSIVHLIGFKPRTEAVAQRFQKLIQMGFIRLGSDKQTYYSRLTEQGNAALNDFIKLKSN
jgi:hypothetical protein